MLTLLENDLEILISETVLGLGISPRTRGYQCIKLAISACLSTPELAANFRGLLYPYIGERMEMTVGAVERAIRHAISSGWYRHDERLSAEIFRNLLQSRSDTPMNTLFITAVTEWIRLRYPELLG